MEKKIHQDMALLQDLMEKAERLEGVEVVPGDGFVMMSPVSLEYIRTFRHLTGVFDEQLDPAQGLEGKSPDVVLWSPVEDPQRGAHLIELACEIVSPSSVENDYLVKAAAYAVAKIGVYLVLDPYVRRAVLFTRPTDGAYRTREEFGYGETVELPLDVGTVRVDTGRLPVAPPRAQRDAWPRHRTG